MSLWVGLAEAIQEYLISLNLISLTLFSFPFFLLFCGCSSTEWLSAFYLFETGQLLHLLLLTVHHFLVFAEHLYFCHSWISFLPLLYIYVKDSSLSTCSLLLYTPQPYPEAPTPNPDICLTAAQSHGVTPCYKYKCTQTHTNTYTYTINTISVQNTLLQYKYLSINV